MTFKTRMSVLALSTPVLAFVLVGGLMGADQRADLAASRPISTCGCSTTWSTSC